MDLSLELSRYGPDSALRPTLEESQEYCRALARSHYENFTVVSRLWPPHLHQHLCNVYAYCRWADDLADETHDARSSLALLDWWEQSLRNAREGKATHPVFVSLRETIREHDIPAEPFLDLLTAFRRDQVQSRYATEAELLDYCRYSANPVGRIVLRLGGSFDEENARLSDSICTGLQLANFAQDVKRDFDNSRIYIPLDECDRHQVSADELGSGPSDGKRKLLALQSDRARRYLLAGEPLVGRVSADLRLPVRLFIDGGLAIVRAIERQGYDVWTRRPTIGRLQKLQLLMRGFLRTKLALR
jgi:squalene synthase HpnC